MREAEQTLTGQRSQVLASLGGLLAGGSEQAHGELLDLLLSQSEARGQSLGQLNLALLALVERHLSHSPSTLSARRN